MRKCSMSRCRDCAWLVPIIVLTIAKFGSTDLKSVQISLVNEKPETNRLTS